MKKHPLIGLPLVFLLLLVLIPFILLIIWSFTARWPWPSLFPESLTLRAVATLFEPSSQMPELLLSSFLLAALTAIFSTAIGLCTARAVEIYGVKWRAPVQLCSILPLLIPDSVFAIGIHLTLLKIGLADTLIGVLLVHLILATPYSIIIMGDITAEVGNSL